MSIKSRVRLLGDVNFKLRLHHEVQHSIISLLVWYYMEYSSPVKLSFLHLYIAIMPSQACKNDNLFRCMLSFLHLYNAIIP